LSINGLYLFIPGTHTCEQCIKYLTHWTTCASELPEKDTSEKNCRKRPASGGGKLAQATRVLAGFG
jgi:hypothetical protein